jgi:predicted PurR-regulated permease PerM
MLFKRKVFFYICGIIILLLIFYFIFHFRGKINKILTPFFMAIIIAYLLNPIVLKLESKKISRMIGIIMIYFIFLILLAFLTIFMIPELINNIKELMNTVPEIVNRYQGLFNNSLSFIKTSNWPNDVKDALFVEIQNGTKSAQLFIMDTLRKSLTSLIDAIAMFLDLVLSMIIAYYFIKDADFFKTWVLSLTPRRWRNGIIKTGREIHGILSNFIQGQLITALIVGIMEMIGLSLIHVKYPLILGVIGGIANVIPYFGPIIGAIPAVAIALIQSPMKVVATIVVFTVIQQIDNAFISPKIIEGKLGLHPVSTILAVLIGGQFFGIIGMLVSVPIMAIMKTILKNSLEAIV